MSGRDCHLPGFVYCLLVYCSVAEGVASSCFCLFESGCCRTLFSGHNSHYCHLQGNCDYFRVNLRTIPVAVSSKKWVGRVIRPSAETPAMSSLASISDVCNSAKMCMVQWSLEVLEYIECGRLTVEGIPLSQVWGSRHPYLGETLR